MAYTSEGERPDPNSRARIIAIDVAINVGTDETPNTIPITLRFELFKADANGNQIKDSDPDNNDRGLFDSTVVNLIYREYQHGKSADPTYTYSPGKGLSLEAKKEKSGDIKYTILLPLSNDGQDNSIVKFPFNKFEEESGNVRDLFDCIVKRSEIPDGQIDLAINDLSFIIDEKILALSDEITKIE